MTQSIEGGCQCGAVRYEAEAPTLFCAHCHCSYCRRAHGAAFVTWFGVAEERFHLRPSEPAAPSSGATNPEAAGEALRWYASSKQSRRGFCAHCGTTLFFASALCPGEMHVALATATTAIDREPSAECFVEQRVAWGHSGGALRQLRGDGDELGKFRTVSQHGDQPD